MSHHTLWIIAAATYVAVVTIGRAMQMDWKEHEGLPCLVSLSCIVLGFALGFVLGPLVMIWALNTLFVLGIPYTVETCLAVLVLATLKGGRTKWKEKQG